jgi:hypothetical protein
VAGLQTGAFSSPGAVAKLSLASAALVRAVPGIKNEFKFSYIFDQWNKMLHKSQPLSIPATRIFPSATPSVAFIAGDAPSEEAAHQETITQTTEPV